MNKPRLVYTAIFGGYDRLEPIKFQSNCDFIFFTDVQVEVPGWKVVQCDVGEYSSVLMNRKLKILGHRYLSNYDDSLYIDGNIVLTKSPDELIDLLRDSGTSFAAPFHPFRNCIYQEGEYLLKSDRLSSVEKAVLRQQLGRYREAGMPVFYGLSENNVIFRRHKEVPVAQMCSLWWREFSAGCPRDQIALPYALWKTGVTLERIKEGPRYSSCYFDYRLHVSNVSPYSIINWIKLMIIKRRQTKLKGLLAWIADILISIARLIRPN